MVNNQLQFIFDCKKLYIMVRKSDPAWTQVDRVPGSENTVVCKLCRTKLSLGATKRNFSISSVKRHLESQHKSVFFTLYVKTSEDCDAKRTIISSERVGLGVDSKCLFTLFW